MSGSNDDFTRPIDEILQGVYVRGKKLRRRRMLDRGVTMTLFAAIISGTMAIAFIGQTSQIPPTQEITMPPAPEKEKTYVPTPKPEPTKTTKKKTEPIAKPKPAPEPTKSYEPKPDLVCLNSFDPACGEFYWKSKPASKQPLYITVDAPQFVAGEMGGFTVRLSDGDALVAERAYKVFFGDGTYAKDYTDKACKKAYGPWTLPPKQGDTYERGFAHTYTEPGTYTVQIYWLSIDRFDGPRPCQSAYGSEGWTEIEVTVVAAEPDPTPTP